MRIVITYRKQPGSETDYEALIRDAFASAKRMGYETVLVGPDNSNTGADLHLEFHNESMPLMNWILAAQLAYIESPLFSCESVFFSPDALIVRPLKPVFMEDFDIGFTDRPHKRMPINNGVIFLKPLHKDRLILFWGEALEICKSYSDDIQAWYGDQMALADMLGHARHIKLGARIRLFPCSTHNASLHKDCDIVDLGLLEGMYIVHFKGKRKHMMAQYWRALQ